MLCCFHIPPKEEVNTIVDKIKDFFERIRESFGSVGSLPAASQVQVGESKDKKNKK